MTVKYAAARPDETKDALQALEEKWTDNPVQDPEPVVVVGIAYRYGIQRKGAADSWQATAGLQHVEVLDGAEAEQARELLSAAYQRRTGDAQLDLPEDPEDDVVADVAQFPAGSPFKDDAA